MFRTKFASIVLATSLTSALELATSLTSTLDNTASLASALDLATPVTPPDTDENCCTFYRDYEFNLGYPARLYPTPDRDTLCITGGWWTLL